MTFWRRLVEIDRRLSVRLALVHRSRALRLPALAAAHSGDSPLWLAGAIVACLWGDAFWCGLGGRVFLGTLVAGTATTVLKWLFRRRRPPGNNPGLYIHLDRHSFPSGHAGRSACLLVLVAPLLPAWGITLLTLWGGLVGLARVILGVHFVSDIIGGWVIGVLVGLALLTAL